MKSFVEEIYVNKNCVDEAILVDIHNIRLNGELVMI